LIPDSGRLIPGRACWIVTFCFNRLPEYGNPKPKHVEVRLISLTNFNAQFFYSLTMCMLHYNPRHVSSINMPIFRRTNCIITTSGIVALCKWLHSMPDESRLLIRHSVQPFTENNDTRCFDNTICPPEDGHVNARNMSRIVM
jgi:hypothetical protein